MWDLGSSRSNPCESIAVINNNIELRLGHVGVVEKLWVLDFKSGNHSANFDSIVKIILSRYGHINVQGFLNTIDRIYAVPTFLCSEIASNGLLPRDAPFQPSLRALQRLFSLKP